MGRLIDLTGKKFGRLLVLGRAENCNNGSARWDCRCDCGGVAVSRSDCLRTGHTKSCGCLCAEAKIKHGLRWHPLYRVWDGIKKRCFNKNDPSFKDYGARNISVCEEWVVSFKLFYDFAINNGWKPGLTIDRVDNDKDYRPGNCRFVTSAVNNQNTRKSKIWFVDGIAYNSLKEAAVANNTNRTAIRARCGLGGNNGNPLKAKPGCWFKLRYPVKSKVEVEHVTITTESVLPSL